MALLTTYVASSSLLPSSHLISPQREPWLDPSWVAAFLQVEVDHELHLEVDHELDLEVDHELHLEAASLVSSRQVAFSSRGKI